MIRKSGYRFSERSYASQKLAGVTRFDLSRVYRAPRGPVVVPVEQWPRAARERFAKPRAGTALAPHLDRIRNAPFGERDSLEYVTGFETRVKSPVTIKFSICSFNCGVE